MLRESEGTASDDDEDSGSEQSGDKKKSGKRKGKSLRVSLIIY
jgi:hypothetical protein